MWALRRQVFIVISLFFVITIPVFYLTYKGFFKEPACADGFKNGQESGVDCGGSCSLICQESVKPIEVSWVKYFKNDNGSYDIALMLHNPNEKTAPEYVAVKLSLLSVTGAILYQSNATTSVPVADDLPLIIQNTYLRDTPAKFSFEIEEGRTFSTARDRVGDVATKVVFDESSPTSAKVFMLNKMPTALLRFPVRVVAYGADMKAIAVTETKVSSLSPSLQSEVFVNFGKPLIPAPFAFKVYIPLSPYENQQ